MKYVMIFHANLNYAYLTPDRYEFVIRNAYELTFDTMREQFPGTKYVFEASGYTIEQMAEKTPDVLEKLKAAIADGTCEFMGSPYAHPMLPNFPEEDGVWSLNFSNDVFEKHLGMRPVSFWNPECGWRDYVPRQVVAAGFKNMSGDFEAYTRSLGPDGKPNRPEIYELEKTDDDAFYHFGYKYDLSGDDVDLHFPFNKVHGLEDDQLRVFLRSDRICQYAVRYFMGMEGYSFEEYMNIIKQYSKENADKPGGATVIFADDAEYIGTNGWFRLKYQNEPDRVFEQVPGAREMLIQLVAGVKELGEFATFDEACALTPSERTIKFDDDSAWHGAKASVWASTPMARLLRPWQQLVRDELVSKADQMPSPVYRRAWFHLTNSYNSDGQWPPTLPDAPHIIHPFNYQYCFDNLLTAHLLVGGVDLNKLDTDAAKAIAEVLPLQQKLVLDKARELLTTGDEQTKQQAAVAVALIESMGDFSSLEGHKTLQASEYAVRADALVEARRLVGGVEIERVEDMAAEA